MYPHYYQNIQGWFDFEYIYLQMISKASKDEVSRFVEVGSWLGKSASFMGVEIKNSGKPIKLNCVDLWEYTDHDPFYADLFDQLGDDVYPIFLDNMIKSNISDIITPLKMDSVTASTRFQDNSLDFVFIDANHHYEFVKKDIEAWYPKVKPGGTIAGHDYIREVKQAVDEFFTSPVKHIGTSWLTQKK